MSPTICSPQVSGKSTSRKRFGDQYGTPVSGTAVTLSGNVTSTTTTDNNGDYVFNNVQAGSYTLTPSKSDPIITYAFSPSSYNLSLSSNRTVNFTATSSITASLSPIADAYVQDGTPANTNFGAATNLKAQTDTKTNNGKNFDSYFKFDLNGINRNVQVAKLRIFAASSTTGSVTTSAYSVGLTNWVESGTGGITWNNKPALSASPLPGASLTIAGTAYASYDIDVTDYIKSEKIAGRNIISLALHNPSPSTVYLSANSREANTNKPQLVITTSGSDNVAPMVTMSAPTNGAVFGAPASITVSANASDVDGAISRVDFYHGTTLIGSSTSPVSGSTYTVNWSNVPAGDYVLTAIAFDNYGAQTTAAPTNISVSAVNNLPNVSMTSPLNNSTFAVGSNIGLTATASDPDGSINKVEFFYGSILVGTATTPISGNSYAITWSNVPTGSYAVTAKATDNAGGVGTSAPINVSVVGQIGLSPTADAYVQDGSSVATNFGTAAELRAQLSPTAGSNRETYLKFDVTAATGINKATLRIYGRLNDTSGTNVPVTVYPVSATTWTESGNGSLTWNNKPAADPTALASTTIIDNTAKWYDLDLTSYIQSEKAAGRNVVSVVIKGSANSSPYATFNSREAATNQPQLVVLTSQPRNALLVVGSATLNSGDNAAKTRLENLGYSVTVKVAGSTNNTSVKSTDADGKALVLVSSTVTAANVGTKLRNIPVPVLNWEFDLADDFGMTSTVSGTDFGTTTSQTQVAITTPSHPMSAGLTGTAAAVTAASTFSWGKPNANAVQIASLTGDLTRSVIYGYDVGTPMFGIESPARRVAVFLSDTTAASLTPDGGALFDAAVKWATQIDISPMITGLSPTSGLTGTPVTISGMNFGATQGGSTVTFNGVLSSVLNWTNTSINTTVPVGATTGPVVVTVNGVSSNGVVFTVNNPNNDTDGDGLPDDWEITYFGHLGYGANDDPDGDGVSNLQEFLQGETRRAGSSPTLPR